MVVSAHIRASGSLKFLGAFMIPLAAAGTAEFLVRELCKKPSATRAGHQTCNSAELCQLDDVVHSHGLDDWATSCQGTRVKNPLAPVIYVEKDARRVLVQPRVEFYHEPPHSSRWIVYEIP